MDNGKKMKAIVYCTIIACLKLHHTGAFDIGQTSIGPVFLTKRPHS